MGCESSYFTRKPFPRAVYETFQTSDHYAEVVEVISTASGLYHQRNILSEIAIGESGSGANSRFPVAGSQQVSLSSGSY
jgi:hypothetical protein